MGFLTEPADEPIHSQFKPFDYRCRTYELRLSYVFSSNCTVQLVRKGQSLNLNLELFLNPLVSYTLHYNGNHVQQRP